MINEPDIFLLEENTVGLDLEIAPSTRELLRHLRNETLLCSILWRGYCECLRKLRSLSHQ